MCLFSLSLYSIYDQTNLAEVNARFRPIDAQQALTDLLFGTKEIAPIMLVRSGMESNPARLI